MFISPDYSYPFAVFRHSEQTLRGLREFVAKIITQYGLFQRLEPQTTAITSFATTCTSRTASIAALEAACLYVTLVLYVDDEGEGSTNTERMLCYQRYRDILLGTTTTPQSRADEVLLELLDRVETIAASTNVPTVQFRTRTLEMFAAQYWERDAVERTNHTHTLSDYFNVRPKAIANSAWISLFKIVDGVDETRLDVMMSTRFLVLEELVNRLIYLLNDIFSAGRERKDPTALNLVCILERTTSMSWAECLKAAWRLHESGVSSFLRLRDEIRSEPHAHIVGEIDRYLDFLEVNTSGNLLTILENPARYQLPQL